MTTAHMTGYTLKGLKTLQGSDGLAFNATVMFNGKKVAEASDDGNGGCMMIHAAILKRAPQVEFDKAGLQAFFDAALRWFMESGRHAEQVAQFKKWDEQAGRPHKEVVTTAQEAAEAWINEEIDRLANEKRFDRASKTKTLFRVKGDKEGEYRTMSAPYSQKIVDAINKKYGDKVEMIYVPTKLRTEQAPADDKPVATRAQMDTFYKNLADNA